MRNTVFVALVVSLLGALAGCEVNEQPTPPSSTTVIHDKTPSAPTINVTPPPTSSHTETNTTTTPSPTTGGGTQTQTSTTTTG